MTTAVMAPSEVAQLRPLLARRHAVWLAELEAVLRPARSSDAGPWSRWKAQRYFETVFPDWVRAERQLVRTFACRLSERETSHLWALGELLEMLPQHLGHVPGLCHCSSEFADLTSRISAALDRWCRATEEALGPLPVNVVSKEVREALK